MGLSFVVYISGHMLYGDL